MDKKKFYDAVNMIDDDLIKEAEISPEKLAKADTGAEDGGMTVSGVEVYSSRIKWHRIAAAAAVLVLAVGIGSAGYAMFRNRAPLPNEETEETTAESSEYIAAEVSTKESNDIKEEATTSAKNTKAADKDKVTSAAGDKKDDEKPADTDKKEQATEAVVQVTVQQNTNPTEAQKPKTTSKTTAKTTTKATTTKRTEAATTTKAPEPSEKMDVFARLNELTYYPETCDGLPEYGLNAPGDTEVFSINFSSKWVWRNGSTSNPVQMEAALPDDLADYLMAHGEEIGMYPATYSIPVPMQNYSFNAQYIRTNSRGGGGSYPQKKLVTSRSELDSYIDSIRDKYYIDGEFLGHDSLIEAAEKYDDSWFSSHKLMIVVLQETSGSNRHRVSQVSGIGVTIERLLPQVGTCDMAQWHILIEVDKDVYVHNDFMVSTYDTHVQDNWLT